MSSAKRNRVGTTGSIDAAIDFATLVELSPIGVVLLDTRQCVLHLNATSAKLLHGTVEDLTGKPFADRIHREDIDRFKLAIASRSLGSRNGPAFDVRLLSDDGRETWASIDVAESDADSAEFVLWLTDVSDRKRRELERGVWEERWNSALVSSTLGVWDHDFKKGSMYYSDTWKKLRGMQPDDPVLSSTEEWIETVHPDDRAYVLEWIRKQNEGEVTTVTFEYREKRKDGKWVWIECRGSSIELDENGKPTRIVGTDLDITERKAGEEMLESLSRRLELALDVTQIGVFEADLTDGTVLFDDRLLAIMDLTGQPNRQPGEDWFSIIHPDDREASQAHIAANISRGIGFSNYFRIIHRNGDIRHIRAKAAPLHDQSGHVKYIGANWDVTDDIAIRDQLEGARMLAEARNRELESTRAEIEHNALHDFLTDLPNRRYLDWKLNNLRDGQKGLAVLHIDLDRFKQINDTLGHQAGDFVLLHAARILTSSIGSGDFVARIGGDEFVVICDYTGDRDRLVRIADRIIERMREPVVFNDIACRIGASIGISYDPSPRVDARQLLLNADIALYRAKSQGRNRHEFFSIEIHSQIINNKRTSDEILIGLEQRQFVPHYQLQFCANTLDVAGAESLARWQHPTRGLISPDAFLPIAGELDVVGAIDSMIFEQAVADFAHWQTTGIDIPKVSVNVSMRRLYDPKLTEKLSSVAIKPGTVSFELLESIFLDDCDEIVIRNLHGLKRLGIDIEIDDFGSGHASIVSLLKINPKTLKIDRELVKPITKTREQRKLIKSIIEIAKSLDIRVVAEGVETAEHIRILRDLGCDVLQGYALARPMPNGMLKSFVRSRSWKPGS